MTPGVTIRNESRGGLARDSRFARGISEQACNILQAPIPDINSQTALLRRSCSR